MVIFKDVKNDTNRIALVGDVEDLEKVKNTFHIIDEQSAKYSKKNTDIEFIEKVGKYHITQTGLKAKIVKMCDNLDIDVEDHSTDYKRPTPINLKDLNEFIDKHTYLGFNPYSHQLRGVGIGINQQRAFLLSATGSGKSLIIFLLSLFFLNENKRGLIIVPSVDLVSQLFSDFTEYLYKSIDSELIKIENDIQLSDEYRIKLINKLNAKRKSLINVDDTYQKIHAGQDKFTDHPWKITTWQSIYNEPADSPIFDNIDCVIYDEAHKIKAESYKTIAYNLRNATVKIGMSGTLPPKLIESMQLEAMTAQAVRIVSQKELVELGLATKVEVIPLVIKHSEESGKFIRKYPNLLGVTKWVLEDNFIRFNQPRIDFIASLIHHKIAPTGNTIVLFRNVEHGKMMHEALKLLKTDVVFISGSVKAKDREMIRTTFDEYSTRVLVATDKIIATGINIKSLKNGVFLQRGKDEITTIQGLGRLMRLHQTKSVSYIYDIVDDLRGKTVTHNYYLKHFYKRVESYIKYEFDILKPKIKEVNTWFKNDVEKYKFINKFSKK